DRRWKNRGLHPPPVARPAALLVLGRLGAGSTRPLPCYGPLTVSNRCRRFQTTANASPRYVEHPSTAKSAPTHEIDAQSCPAQSPPILPEVRHQSVREHVRALCCCSDPCRVQWDF